MPLKKGKKNIGKNIKTEMAQGKSKKQAVAVAMSMAGMSKKHKMSNGMMMTDAEMKKQMSAKKGYEMAMKKLKSKAK